MTTRPSVTILDRPGGAGSRGHPTALRASCRERSTVGAIVEPVTDPKVIETILADLERDVSKAARRAITRLAAVPGDGPLRSEARRRLAAEGEDQAR